MRLGIQRFLACLACVCMIGLGAKTTLAAGSGSWNGNNGSTAWDGANFIDDSLIDVDPLNPLPSLGAGIDLEPHIIVVDAFSPGGSAAPNGIANTLFPIIPAGQDAVAARLFMGVSAGTTLSTGTASITVQGKLTANTGGTSTLGRNMGATSTLNIDGGDVLLGNAQIRAGEVNINVTNGGRLRFGDIVGGSFFAATGSLRPLKNGALGRGTADDDITGTLTIDDSLVELDRLRIDLSEAAFAATATSHNNHRKLDGAEIHQFMVDIIGSGSLVVHNDVQALSYLPGSGEEYSLYELANIDGLIKGNGVPGNVNFTPTFKSDGVTVDFVTITAVPEPASLALLGLGVLSIAAMRNRAARLR